LPAIKHNTRLPWGGYLVVLIDDPGDPSRELVGLLAL